MSMLLALRHEEHRWARGSRKRSVRGRPERCGAGMACRPSVPRAASGAPGWTAWRGCDVVPAGLPWEQCVTRSSRSPLHGGGRPRCCRIRTCAKVLVRHGGGRRPTGAAAAQALKREVLAPRKRALPQRGRARTDRAGVSGTRALARRSTQRRNRARLRRTSTPQASSLRCRTHRCTGRSCPARRRTAASPQHRS